jgi:type IV pilus assembly protein PilE
LATNQPTLKITIFSTNEALQMSYKRINFQRPTSPQAQQKIRGFSLLELMIVLAIVAILARISYPSYKESVAKTKRAQAAAQLLEVAQFMQRFYSQNDRYDQTNQTVPVAAAVPAVLANAPKDSPAANANYNISFPANTLKSNSFTLQAVPANSMVGDRCGTLQLTSTGRRFITDNADGSTLANCWR